MYTPRGTHVRSLARRKPGVQIPSPPPPTSQVRASPSSSRRRSLHGAAALRPYHPSNSSAGKASSDQAARLPGPSRPSAGPARPAPASRARLQPRADDAPSWTRRATTPTPGHPSHAAAGPRHARDLIPVGHSGRRNVRTPDAGRWRPDSGHLDAQTPAPDTPWNTGRPHRTPDTGC
jgi:hypothetical protein